MRFLSHLAVLCLLLTTLPGCGDLDNVLGNPQDRAKHAIGDDAAEPFEIGPASEWAQPGLYLTTPMTTASP